MRRTSYQFLVKPNEKNEAKYDRYDTSVDLKDAPWFKGDGVYIEKCSCCREKNTFLAYYIPEGKQIACFSE